MVIYAALNQFYDRIQNTAFGKRLKFVNISTLMFVFCYLLLTLFRARARVCGCVRETDIQAILEDKLSEALCTATHPLADTADDEWTFIRDSTYRVAADVLGYKRYAHRDWFDENNLAAIQHVDELHHKHLAWISDKNSVAKKESYKQARKTTQRELRTM